jgi:hypothetical protein
VAAMARSLARNTSDNREQVVNLASAQLIGRPALTGLALAHGYDTAFWWIAGIFVCGAVLGGVLLRRGPLVQKRTPSTADDRVTPAQAEASRERAQ